MIEPSLDAVWSWLIAQRRVFLAVVALIGGWYVGRLLVRLFGRRVSRRFQRPSITRTALRLVRTVSLLAGILLALTFLQVPITQLALSVTVFSAVLGLVLAPIVGSVINGVFVLADQPYEIGDMIELADGDRRGFVEDVTLRYTKIFTLDNTFLVIPNSTMRDRDVINYSAEDERTRLSLRMGVTYEGNLAKARRIMEEAASEIEEVISGGPDIRIGSARYPARPMCYIDKYGDNGVILLLRYWVREPYRIPALQSQVQTEVWERLEAADDVEIAYPHRHLFFDDTSGTARVSLQNEDWGGTSDGAKDADPSSEEDHDATPPTERERRRERERVTGSGRIDDEIRDRHQGRRGQTQDAPAGRESQSDRPPGPPEGWSKSSQGSTPKGWRESGQADSPREQNETRQGGPPDRWRDQRRGDSSEKSDESRLADPPDSWRDDRSDRS